MWWCCSKCVAKAEATFQPAEEEEADVIEIRTPQHEQAAAKSSCNQVDLVTMISNQFKSLKDELMNSVNDIIEAKVSYVLNQNISDDSTHTAPPYLG